MNLDIIFSLLKERYSAPGKHLTQVYDDPLFQRLPLSAQSEFVQKYRSDFTKEIPISTSVGMTHWKSAVLPGSLLGGALLHTAVKNYPGWVAQRLTPEMVSNIASGWVAKQGLGAAEAAASHANIVNMASHDFTNFAWLSPTVKEFGVKYLKSPEFLKTVGKIGGTALAVYVLAALAKRSVLKQRQRAALTATSPEEAQLGIYSATTPFHKPDVVRNMASTFINGLL